MCRHCSSFSQNSFNSNEEFDLFDSVLLSSKDIFSYSNTINKGEVNAAIVYECKQCKDKWYLSVPNQAHRGFFLSSSSYLAKEKSMELKRKKLRTRVLVLVVIVVTLITAKLLQIF